MKLFSIIVCSMVLNHHIWIEYILCNIYVIKFKSATFVFLTIRTSASELYMHTFTNLKYTVNVILYVYLSTLKFLVIPYLISLSFSTFLWYNCILKTSSVKFSILSGFFKMVCDFTGNKDTKNNWSLFNVTWVENANSSDAAIRNL